METFVPKPIEEYATAHTTPPADLLNELEAYTIANCEFPQMLVGRLEGTLLKILVKLTGARRILEIGLYTGYSALFMAEALPDDGEIISCEINPDNAKVAQSFLDRSPHGHKIKIRLGPALETIKGLPAEAVFDLVFVDADKENYTNYYEAVMPKLRSGGIIVADNVLWSGNVLKPKEATDRAIVAFNNHIQQDARTENVMLTVRDGVMLAVKR